MESLIRYVVKDVRYRDIKKEWWHSGEPRWRLFTRVEVGMLHAVNKRQRRAGKTTGQSHVWQGFKKWKNSSKNADHREEVQKNPGGSIGGDKLFGVVGACL